MECLSNTIVAFRGDLIFLTCLHCCDKDFSLLLLTALSSETSGGAEAEGRKAAPKGESSPFREMCTEVSGAEGRAAQKSGLRLPLGKSARHCWPHKSSSDLFIFISACL